MQVFRITPMDSKGEIDGNSWVTMNKEEAVQESFKGNFVESADVKGFHPVEISFNIARKTSN